MSEKVISTLEKYSKDFDFDKIQAALDLASGTANTAKSLIDLIIPFGPDEDTILVCILLVPALKGDLDHNQIKERFGVSVCSILEAVKKLESVGYAGSNRDLQLEVLRRMFLAMAKNIRVILVALVYRLFELNYLAKNYNKGDLLLLANETLNIYVPVAGRLGMYNIKTELEDIAFQYANPREYKKIVQQLRVLQKKSKVSIGKVASTLVAYFAEKGMKVKVFGRIKGLYSIYSKLDRKGLKNVNELSDIFALRLILPCKVDKNGNEVVDHLYAALGLVHSEWKAISKRFKDYIAVPKPNGYRSLHTIVVGMVEGSDTPIEIQIRDENMHKDAEYGVAAHWLYKDTGFSKDERMEYYADWLKGVQKIREELAVGNSVFNDTAVDIFKDRIFILTPKGEVKDLPAGSSPLDFAYSVHTDVGHTCYMAKVNNKAVPLSHKLKNGEMVEIITRKDSHPRIQWLSMVKTDAAKTKVRGYFNALNKERDLKEGRRILNDYLKKLGKPALDPNFSIFKNYMGENLSVAERASLVAEIGKGGKMISDVLKKVFPNSDIDSDMTRERGVSSLKPGKSVGLDKYIVIGDQEGLPIKIAACCKPRYGDDIIGYVTRGNRVTVHRAACVLVDSLDGDRIIFASWKGRSDKEKLKYRVGVLIMVMPRVGLMRDMTSKISGLGFNILDIKIKRLKENLSENYFLLEFDSFERFNGLLEKLEAIEGVFTAKRDGKKEMVVES